MLSDVVFNQPLGVHLARGYQDIHTRTGSVSFAWMPERTGVLPLFCGAPREEEMARLPSAVEKLSVRKQQTKANHPSTEWTEERIQGRQSEDTPRGPAKSVLKAVVDMRLASWRDLEYPE